MLKHFKFKEKSNIITLLIVFFLLITTLIGFKSSMAYFYGEDKAYAVSGKQNNVENELSNNEEGLGKVRTDDSVNILAQAGNEIYLDPSSGNDGNDGTTADTAVKTFDKAKSLAEAAEAQTIYLCSTLYLTENISGENRITLKRYGESFTDSMIKIANGPCNITYLTIDGGAVWTGDVDETLGRGTTNSGIAAKNSMIKDEEGMGVTIFSCTLQNNDNTSELVPDCYGGAFYGSLIGSTANLKILNNSAKIGGGIYVNSSGMLEMTYSEISGNSATNNGGGIYSEGDTMLNGVTVGGANAGNTAQNGGGIYINSGNTVLNFYYNPYGSLAVTKITHNTATSNGGGIYVNSSGTLDMTNGEVSGNGANNYGGGIYSYGTTTLNGVTVGGESGGNTAKSGGGLYVNNGTTTLQPDSGTATVVSHNTATSDGGGIYVGSSGELNMTKGEISENNATYSGGGIYSYGSTTLKGVTVGGENAGNTAGEGGGICVYSGTTTLQPDYAGNATVVKNNEISGSGSGGGICVYSSGTLNMTKGEISGNTATYSGGGIYTLGSITLNGVTVGGKNAGNTSNKDGGGIYVTSTGTLNMTKGEISGNGATTSGGGIYTSGTTTLNGVTVGGENGGNTARSGGGIYVYRGTTTLQPDDEGTATVVSHNTATSNGGGIYVSSSGTLNMTKGEISGNTATYSGGGINSSGSTTLNGVTVGGESGGNTTQSESGGGLYVYGGTTKLQPDNAGTATVVSHNTATINGGGIYVDSSGTLNMTKGEISGNGATNYGGGIYSYGSTTLNGVTIGGDNASNTATNGGGLYVYNGTTTLQPDSGTATVVSHNTATTSGGGIYVASAGTLNMTKGEISGNSATNYGGGIYASGDTTLNGVTVGGANAGNTAKNGGGICVYGKTTTLQPDSGTATVVSHNTAKNHGGGIYVFSSSTLNMTNGEISGNGATNDGGGIYSEGTTTLKGVALGVESAVNTAKNGGGIYVYSKTTTLQPDDEGNATVVSHNTATSSGGGIYNRSIINTSGTIKVTDGVYFSKTGVINVVGALADSSEILLEGASSIPESEVFLAVKTDGTYAMTESDAEKFNISSSYRLIKSGIGTTSAEIKIALPLTYTITIPDSISGEDYIMKGDFDISLSGTMLSSEKLKMDIIVPEGGLILAKKIDDGHDNTKYLNLGFGLTADNIKEYPNGGTYEILNATKDEMDAGITQKVHWQFTKPEADQKIEVGTYEVPNGVTFSFSVVSA